jgi:hypothetical protein
MLKDWTDNLHGYFLYSKKEMKNKKLLLELMKLNPLSYIRVVLISLRILFPYFMDTIFQYQFSK